MAQPSKAIQAALSKIQKELIAPKDAYNSFGKYSYRSAESILSHLKPLLPEGATITFDDDVRQIGERYYVVSTVSFNHGGESISAKAWAREPTDKKGCDAAQITGGVTSYARKYALGALLIIDDNPDSDATSKQNQRDEVYKGDEFRYEKELTRMQTFIKNSDKASCATLWAKMLSEYGRAAQVELHGQLSKEQQDSLQKMLAPPSAEPAPQGSDEPAEPSDYQDNVRHDGSFTPDEADQFNEYYDAQHNQ